MGAFRTFENETLSRTLPGIAVPWTPGNRFARSEPIPANGDFSATQLGQVTRVSGTVLESWKQNSAVLFGDKGVSQGFRPLWHILRKVVLG